MLYDGPFTWKAGEPVSYRIHIVYYEKMIFISDNQKGFYIEVFNSKGEHLYTINKNEEIDRIPIEGNEQYFHPLLHHFQISDNKIYAITNKKIDNKNEIIILDLKGNILKRVFLPMLSKIPGRRPLRFDLFDADQGKLYELIKNDEIGKWVLYITEL
jgi:hypothetical protein